LPRPARQHPGAPSRPRPQQVDRRLLQALDQALPPANCPRDRGRPQRARTEACASRLRALGEFAV